MIEFVPFNETHIPLMHAWLSCGEALRWYGGDEPKTEAGLRQKYLVEKPQGGTRSFMVRYDGELIGHLQYYRVTDYPEWAALVSGQPHDYGLDVFIGRDDRIAQGIGTQIVKAALDRLVFAHPAARRCILGPSPDNGRAIRCYEKCGFRHAETVVTEAGEQEYIMVVERSDAMCESP